MSLTAQQSENPSDYVVAGVVSVLNGDSSMPFPAFGPRIPVQMSGNRIEVRAGGFARATDLMNVTAGGKYYYAHKRGILSVTVITQRINQQGIGQDSNHAVAVGRCGYNLSFTANLLTPTAMSGFQVVDIIALGDVAKQDDPTDTDRTELRFQIDLLITPDNYIPS